MKRLFLLLLTSVCAPALQGTPADPTSFEQANRLYEEGHYREAIQGYEALAACHRSVTVHFNLGNAYFKSGQIGKAISHYLQAERLAPRDPDVLANLRFARERVPGPSYKPGWLLRKAQVLTPGEWAIGATAAVWLFLGLLTMRQLQPRWRVTLRRWTALAGVAAATMVASALGSARLNATHHLAVITQSEAVMRLGPFEESQSAANLKDGAELRVLDRKDAWLQVTADDRQMGWVPSGAVREIQP